MAATMISSDGFTVIDVDDDDHLNKLIEHHFDQSSLFDLPNGRVFDCQIIRRPEFSLTPESHDNLTNGDLILFKMHHSVFDGASTFCFINDLSQAYKCDREWVVSNDTLQYIDYSVHERVMDMSPSRDFWQSQLHDYDFEHHLALPVDRHRVVDHDRSGQAFFVQWTLDNDLCRLFFEYASSRQVTPFQLGLATFYAFLLKLTNGQSDLCVAGINANRYRDEPRDIIGMFVATLPYRVEVDPQASFDVLVKQVRDQCLSILEHTHYPLQHILADADKQQLTAAFLETVFDFISVSWKDTCLTLNEAQLETVSTKAEDHVAKFDFHLSFLHDQSAVNNGLSCVLLGSQDLFQQVTLHTLADRFSVLVRQLYEPATDRNVRQLVNELSIILPAEVNLIQWLNKNTNFVGNAKSSNITVLFCGQCADQPQKMAVELDDQSLTYSELLCYVQQLAVHLLLNGDAKPGEIICQCVERSFAMVIGIMSILMVGAVYCPLSPRDPQQRLGTLVEQIKSRVVLVHWMTRDKFSNNTPTIDIGVTLNGMPFQDDHDHDVLSAVSVTLDSIAYVIFTSGSTGTPKAAQVRHRNFVGCISSFLRVGIFCKNDTVVQMCRCSFDIHLQDIIGTLIIGASLIMIHPHGYVDLAYVLTLLTHKQITYMGSVPSYLTTLCQYLSDCHKGGFSCTLRSVITGGETLPIQLTRKVYSKLFSVFTTRTMQQFWNLYGPAETTIDSTHYLIEPATCLQSVPIGQPLPNYRCLVVDDQLQPVVIGQEGELLVGGVGVFAGYLGRDDLTAKALVDIDGHVFYRTGDLVRLDNNGLLYYLGRKDHQIKLRGQRIELGEIERCLLDTSISACVVIKWGDDHLIAYVQGSDVSQEHLRDHCRSHLPPFMMPSMFIVLEQFPLNANGKLDRKSLPTPGSFILSTPTNNTDGYTEPTDEIETVIHSLWCEILKRSRISASDSIFSIGGHSLLVMQLYHRYRTTFHFDTDALGITQLFQHPSIAEHAQLIRQAASKKQSEQLSWLPLHVIEGRASFAQERIMLDEHIRFSSKNNLIYAIPLIYRVSSQNGTVSIARLRRALHAVTMKHSILRSALYFDSSGAAIQSVSPQNDSPHDHHSFGFAVIDVDNDSYPEDYLENRLQQESLFNLCEGRVFDCRVVRYYRPTPIPENNDLFSNDDLILVNIHHSVFDGGSPFTFLTDLSQAFCTDRPLLVDQSLQYIDYSVHERVMDMSPSRDFWRSQLHNYDFEHRLALPVDRHRVVDYDRSGQAFVVQWTLDNDLCRLFLDYASSHQVTPFQLGLATFYAFLFKLTNGQSDLCVAGINANRYRDELRDMIGMFVATLPYRGEVDRYGSVEKLIEKVRDRCLSIMEQCHYPLQHILADVNKQQSSAVFLETVFDFIDVTSKDVCLVLNETQLEQVPIKVKDYVAKFDFHLSFVHDRSPVNNGLSCVLLGSQDLFQQVTVQTLVDRFAVLVRQLYEPATDRNVRQLVNELSIILPTEVNLTRELNKDVIFDENDTGCGISELFSRQSLDQPQKMAVELDDQSLTYSELLYYVQQLALHLLLNGDVKPGEIICQCVERSLSMVIGMLSILLVGGVYCPLSPHDPEQRLEALVEQTKSRVVLVHWMTRDKFYKNSSTIDIGVILNGVPFWTNPDEDLLSTVIVTLNSIAFVIFTSGSTGRPKAAQVRHRNFIGCIESLLRVGKLSQNDIVAQMARCSFDIHVQDILGTLVIGATLVMLHPNGVFDFEYLATTCGTKQITYMQTVPMLLNKFYDFLQSHAQTFQIIFLRAVCSSGERLTINIVRQLTSVVTHKCDVWNMYGPAEATFDCTYHLISLSADMESVPIGQPLPNYRCLVVDDQLQPVVIGQEGELLVGGVGVFAGYLGRDDLTAKALVDIDGHVFYRTGDLVRLDNNGLLHYVSRKDHQVKLRGQRIELGEIERCLLDTTSISACVVIKWGDEHLIAYVQGSDISQEHLRDHCRSRLPPFMVPSMFIVLEQFPLNANGKLDRRALPLPDFSAIAKTDDTNLTPLTPLEQRLNSIFSRAFHIEYPSPNVSFSQFGGTSLDAILAVTLIREEVYSKLDFGLLMTNPSVRQLARVLEPLVSVHEETSLTTTLPELNNNHQRPFPSMFIETLGILLLIFQWLYPICWALRSDYYFAALFIPLIHVLFYVVFQRLLFRLEETVDGIETLYSWRYYRWWFLERLWSINNTYWLQHLLGTPFYNCYLRLCGARIGLHTHIYTTRIDAPWMLDVGESTFINSETVLSSLSYQDRTYELHPIFIGSHCVIDTRSILYGGVKMQDGVHVESMSVVTGPVSTAANNRSVKDHYSSYGHTIYQFTSLLLLLLTHVVLLGITRLLYQCCSALLLPLPVGLALCWLFWILTSLFVASFLLKFVVGHVTRDNCLLNSHYYLHKIWLRQLIITSFHRAFEFLPSYEVLSPILLRWLGAHVEDDVKLAEIIPLLRFPSNLLNIEYSVTTFAKVTLAPFQMTGSGYCSFDYICLGSDTNLGNGCTIMPGTRLPPNTMIGNLTRMTREISNSAAADVVWLGIPARRMPFVLPEKRSIVDDLSSYDFTSVHSFLRTCLIFLIGACLLITPYSLLPGAFALVVHTILYCGIYRYVMVFEGVNVTAAFSKITVFIRHSPGALMNEFGSFIGPFISRSQYLILLFRALGARIGRDVILPDIHCLTEPHLATIGDHVRLATDAYLQCHTFEQRLLKLAPIIVHHSSVLETFSIVLPGSTLHGRNHLFPYTLVMKNDQLPFNTNWSGVPAYQVD